MKNKNKNKNENTEWKIKRITEQRIERIQNI